MKDEICECQLKNKIFVMAVMLEDGESVAALPELVEVIADTVKSGQKLALVVEAYDAVIPPSCNQHPHSHN